MSHETMSTLLKVSRFFDRTSDPLVLMVAVLLFLTFYMLHQIYRLGFLRFQIIGFLCLFAHWLIGYRDFFIGFPDKAQTEPWEIWLYLAWLGLRFVAVLLIAIGAALGVRFLQRKWKDKESADKALDGTA